MTLCAISDQSAAQQNVSIRSRLDQLTPFAAGGSDFIAVERLLQMIAP